MNKLDDILDLLFTLYARNVFFYLTNNCKTNFVKVYTVRPV